MMEQTLLRVQKGGAFISKCSFKVSSQTLHNALRTKTVRRSARGTKLERCTGSLVVYLSDARLAPEVSGLSNRRTGLG